MNFDKSYNCKITPNSNPLSYDEPNIMFGWYPTYNVKGVYTNDIETLVSKYGINVFVNLTEHEENLNRYDNYLRKNYPYTIMINFPIPNSGIPKDLNLFNQLIDTIISLSVNHKILIHCRGGHGRSGLVAACVLIRKGYEPDRALEMVSTMHKTRDYIPNYPCPETDIQIDFVRKYK